MAAYILRRLLLIVPTLFGIMLINFAIVQAAPGGPVEQAVARLQGLDASGTARVSGGRGSEAAAAVENSKYRGAQGVDPQFIEDLKKQYGFDKSAPERFWLMIKSYVQFDFGKSFYRDKSVTGLLAEKMPVSISLGLWSTLIIYFISIPLGIRKA
ncbi:MAG TPA: microcin ABC transporter permease, partial [Moraxellaceae bacterium]|nr:microcin ABC transporter permease [Moraxellaceae bacterium]